MHGTVLSFTQRVRETTRDNPRCDQHLREMRAPCTVDHTTSHCSCISLAGVRGVRLRHVPLPLIILPDVKPLRETRAPCTVDHTTRCRTVAGNEGSLYRWSYHQMSNRCGKRGLPVPLIIPPDVKPLRETRAPRTVDHTTRCRTIAGNEGSLYRWSYHQMSNRCGKRGLPVPLIIPPDVKPLRETRAPCTVDHTTWCQTIAGNEGPLPFPKRTWVPVLCTVDLSHG